MITLTRIIEMPPIVVVTGVHTKSVRQYIYNVFHLKIIEFKFYLKVML